MHKKQIIGLILTVICIAGFIGYIYTANKTDRSQKLQVAATFYPLSEFASRIAGDRADVQNLAPSGTEPHSFEPSPKTLARLESADIFIYNGGTFEPWVERFLPIYSHTAVKGSQGIDLQSTGEGHDPHYWLDPVLAQKTVATIRDALVRADPDHASEYTGRAATYTAELAKLDADFKTGLRMCSQRTIVISHDAFGYAAARYGLTIIPITGMNHDAEPNPQKITEISKTVRENNIKYIFFERLASPRLAATIAQETGAETAVLDPIEGITDDEHAQGKNYIALQRENLAALRTALSCQ